MKEIIDQLQKQVYKLDRQIASAADDLFNGDERGDPQKWYDTASLNKAIILECIEKLKQTL